MPDCQKYTLTVEAFRVTREDYAEGDVPAWAWDTINRTQEYAKKYNVKQELGAWMIWVPFNTCPLFVTDADFRKHFRRVEVHPEGDSDYMLGWKTAMNGWEKPVTCRCAGQTEDGYANYLRGFADGRAELEARR